MTDRTIDEAEEQPVATAETSHGREARAHNPPVDPEEAAIKDLGFDVARVGHEPLDTTQPVPRPTPEGISALLGGLGADADFFSKAARVGQVWKAAPLPADDKDLGSILSAYAELDLDPALAHQIAQRGWLLLASPEVAMGVRAQYGIGPTPTSEVLKSAFAPLDIDDYVSVENDLNQSALVAQWLQLHTNDFKKEEKDIMYFALSMIPQGRRERVVALAEQFLRNEPLKSEEDRLEFIARFYNWSRDQQQEFLGDQSVVGQIGRHISAPLRATSEILGDAIFGAISSPEEYKWRDPLSFGQNLAISMGTDPSQEWWHVQSGAIDFLMNFVADPINLAAGLGIGSKLAKGRPMPAKLATRGKFRNATRLVMPFFGKKVSGLPRFARGPYTRLGYALFAKTHDDLIEVAAKNGLFKQMHLTVKAAHKTGGTGVSEMLELWPALRDSPSVLDLLTSQVGVAKGDDWYKEIVRMAGNGSITRDPTKILQDATDAHTAARTAFNKLRVEALENGQLDAEVLAFVDESIVPVIYKAKTITTEGGKSIPLLQVQKGFGKGGEGVMLRGPIDILDIGDEAELLALQKWLMRHPLANLSQETDGFKAAKALAQALIDVRKGGRDFLGTAMLASRSDPSGRMMSMLMRYADARGADLISSGPNSLITPKGSAKAIKMIDNPVNPRASKALVQSKMRMARAEESVRALEHGGAQLWFVKDMPTGVPKGMFIKGQWRGHGPKNSTKWFANFRRSASGKMFSPAHPPHVDHTHASGGARSLSAWMRAAGANKQFIDSWLDTYYAAPRELRARVAMDAIIDTAKEIDHPHLQYGIMEYVNRAGIHSYAFDANGGEIGIAAGRHGGTVNIPIMPSHMSMSTILPGKDFFDTLRRFRRAKSRISAMPNSYRGLWKTRSKRTRLLESYKLRLKKAGAPVEQLSDDYLAAMAYATTSGETTGLGAFAIAGQAINKAYSGFHHVFVIAQLAYRPIPWLFRVVLLEEQWRSALTGLPSMFRNPVRQMGTWFDQYFITNAANFRRGQTKLVRSLTRDVFKGVDDTWDKTRILGRIKEFIPEFEDLAGKAAMEKMGSASSFRASFDKVMHQELAIRNRLDILSTKFTPSRAARLRSGKIKISDKTLDKYQLRSSFDWDDVPEIMNKGMGTQFIEESAAAVIDVTYGASMGPRFRHNYGTALSRTMAQLIDDPIMRTYGLGRASLASGHGSLHEYGPHALVKTRGWRQMKSTVARMAEHRIAERLTAPVATNDQIALADWYLREVVDPHIQNIFGKSLWGDGADLDLLEKSRVAQELMRNKVARVERGGTTYSLDFHTNGRHALARETRRMVEDGYHLDHQFPPKLSALFEPRYLGDEVGGIRSGFVRRANQSLMTWAGERMSQQINRRGSWLSAYRESFEHYNALGFSRDAAAKAAQLKASERINYIFYNMDNVVPLLKELNKTSPFISAWWEVLQTWAYKIPMQADWGVGYAMMVRKVDRVFNALQSMGLLRVEDEIDPKSPTKTRRMYFEFAADPDTDNKAGRILSRTGYAAWRAPAVAFNHLVNLVNWGSDPEQGDGWEDKKVMRISVGSPLDPFSHGVGAVNQAYVGTNPLVGRIASEGLALLSEAVDYDKEQSIKGESLSAMAERLEVEPFELLLQNKTRLEEALGEDLTARLYAGTIDADQVALPEMTLLVPDTNMWVGMMENMILPFGRIESDSGAVWGILPSWSQQIWRGLGLWSANGKKEPLATFLEMWQTPSSRAAVSSEVITQIQYLEATEGSLTKLMEAEIAKENIVERAKGELIIQTNANGDVSVVNDDHPLAAEYIAAQRKVRDLGDEMLHRATSNASGALFMRGLIGFYSPSVPQMMHAQGRALSTYYFGRDLSKSDGDRKKIALPPLEIDEDGSYEAFIQLLGGWLEDPTGDRNKMFLKENFPEMWPFVYGKTFWGPAGEPPEIRAIDDYAKQVKAGLREPYPPEVFIQRMERSALALEKETMVLEAFGSDPVQSAADILSDWHTYRGILDDFSVKYTALDEFDSAFGDEYLRWRERNTDDNLTLLDRLNGWVDGLATVIDDLTVPTSDVLDMSAKDRRGFVGQLKATSRQLREAVHSWREDFENNEFRRPRDEFLAQYFEGSIADYYDGLADLYEEVDNARDNEKKARVYDKITEYENTLGLKGVSIEGVRFPSPLEWRWNSWDEEARERQLQEWIVTKPEWLSLWATKHAAEKWPQLEDRLPTSLNQFDLYHDLSKMQTALDDLMEPDITGVSVLSRSQRNDISRKLNQQLEVDLIEQGRMGEFSWRQMTPIQRMSALGILPFELEGFVPMVNAVMDALDANDKGVRSDEGRALFGHLLGVLELAVEQDPRLDEVMADLGDRLFDDTSWDSLVMKLFAGDDFAEV